MFITSRRSSRYSQGTRRRRRPPHDDDDDDDDGDDENGDDEEAAGAEPRRSIDGRGRISFDIAETGDRRFRHTTLIIILYTSRGSVDTRRIYRRINDTRRLHTRHETAAALVSAVSRETRRTFDQGFGPRVRLCAIGTKVRRVRTLKRKNVFKSTIYRRRRRFKVSFN